MNGQVFKIYSDFYYVNTDFGIVVCKLREILKKKQENVIVGDYVELEALTSDKSQAFISKLLKRKNFLSRPKVANVSKAIIVSALKEPDLDYHQLDRYIALCEYHKISPVLCFNKSDLVNDEAIISEIKSIYEPLGYELFFTSALLKVGTEALCDYLKDNISIFCGSSGVGKSSIINLLSKNLKLMVKSVSEKSKRGVHTTRHCEIFNISKNTSVVDTPGFSNVKFSFVMPYDVQKMFPEIYSLNCCKFKNCLHIQETDCNVLNNLEKIAPSRYDSYKRFVDEAKEYKQKIINRGNKVESTSKFNKGMQIAKLSENKRALSRKVIKQNTSKIEEHNV